MAAGRAFLRAAPSSLAAGAGRFAFACPMALPLLAAAAAGPHRRGRGRGRCYCSASDAARPLLDKRVVFITGTDEHGEKIATSAEACGRNPKDHCDTISNSYKMLWADLDIEYDKFIRTTDPKHDAVVNDFYSRVLDSGDIYRADYEGLYCVSCEEYKDEKELGENKCCPVHLKPCVPRKEDNYFFALSKYQHQLEDLLTKNPNFVRPSHRLNEVQGWVKSGLRDFSISRASVEWGIPVPNDTKQTIYVWFDALLGYISALLDDGEKASLQQAVERGWPASVHLIGKDGMKMGKSLGNTLEPKDLVNRFGVDAVRYFFLREVEFGNDGDYSEERFINIVNAHLANTIGNLLNRTLGLLKKNCKSTLAFDSIAAADGISLKDNVENLVDKAKDQFENLLLSSACETLMEIGNLGNLYIDEQAPWSCFKQGGESAEKAAKDLVIILETMRIIAIALSPITPSLSLRIYTQLGFTEDQFRTLRWEDTKWGGLKAGQVMMEPKPVFARLETETDEKDQSSSKPTKGGKKKARTKLHRLPLPLRRRSGGTAMSSVSDPQANGDHQPAAEAEMEDNGAQVEEVADSVETMEGVASIALLPSGAISGHFIRLPDSVCYGLHGTPISCERECSRGEDYRLIKLSIIDFKNKREKVVVVECRGHDAARLQNIDHLHGWEDDIVGLVEKKHGNQKFSLSFECETLKADKAAEEHISKYMPNLRGLDAIVNIGKMSISGINLDKDDEPSENAAILQEHLMYGALA
uniref:methionine--tRNA ligase n=1 Tax=Oryza punctata TaxID=4537 RepID=A0A0E0KAC4_ORYPU